MSQDPKTGELAYNIEDADHPLLPTRETAVQGAQVDPAQKLSRSQGRSPSVILAAFFILSGTAVSASALIAAEESAATGRVIEL